MRVDPRNPPLTGRLSARTAGFAVLGLAALLQGLAAADGAGLAVGLRAALEAGFSAWQVAGAPLVAGAGSLAVLVGLARLEQVRRNLPPAPRPAA